MALYQMNRVPDYHKQKFLKLIIDPPEPVTVPVKLKLTLAPDREEFIVPPGLRFATDFKNGKRYIFETFEETRKRVSGGKCSMTIATRSRKEIEEEGLGVSNGQPNQTFPLQYRPVLLDLVHLVLDGGVG